VFKILEHFEKGFEAFRKVAYLAIIPLFLDIFFHWYEGFLTAFSGTFRMGVKFSIPWDLPSIENFYDFPKITMMLPIYSAIWTTISTVIYAFILGGYLGKIHQAVRGMQFEPFMKLSSKYFIRFLFLKILWLILALPAFFMGMVAIVYIVFLLILGYFLYLTPFIIIADDIPFFDAIRKSVVLASNRGEVLKYALIFIVLTAIVSAFIYLLMNIPIAGFLISVIITSIVGTTFTAATMNFYIHLQEIEHLPTV